MQPSIDTVEYFNSISNKMTMYHKNISIVKKYVSGKKITDVDKISNLVIMSVVWTAFNIGEYLTETDVLVILGSSQNIPYASIMTLDPVLSKLSLVELMEAVNKAYDEKSK
jgi:predicted HAD superfamily phosphohydrolase